MTRRDRYGEPVQPMTQATTVHDDRCVNGWLDRSDNPIPCPDCKPWLVACSNCGKSRKLCEFERGKLGRCCPDCPHIPPVTKTRRKRIRKATNEQETPA